MSPNDRARSAFRTLHERGCFMLPNPWDIGTARYLRQLGFPALATTSAGAAFSRGFPDAGMPLSAALEHIRDIVRASELPVNADFESGFAADAEGVAANVRACVETGVAGLSIEDASGDPRHPLYEIDRATARVAAARAAIAASGCNVLLTARAECHLVGHPDPLTESVRRLTAYAQAGADVLYAPGLRDRAAIRTVVSNLAPKPVNVLMSANLGMRLTDLAELGVRRVSVGSALARATWGGFIRAAKSMAERGDFSGLDGAVPFAELNEFFRKDQLSRF
jgi:2-methylisocitrate lyase-like PEP mutase family enzyme